MVIWTYGQFQGAIHMTTWIYWPMPRCHIQALGVSSEQAAHRFWAIHVAKFDGQDIYEAFCSLVFLGIIADDEGFTREVLSTQCPLNLAIWIYQNLNCHAHGYTDPSTNYQVLNGFMFRISEWRFSVVYE